MRRKQRRRRRRAAKSAPSDPLDEINKTLVQLQTLFRTEGQLREGEDLDQTPCRSHTPPVAQDIQEAVKMITELPVNTNKSLREVIRIIYDRAVSDDKHSIVHADLCHHLKNMKVRASDSSMTFNKMLLHNCMDRFKKDINKAPNVNARSGYFNSMMLLCDLFKREVVTAEDMHDCIAKLLKDPNEDNLYRFCCIMSNVGRDLDVKKSKTSLEKYIQEIQRLMWRKKISSQVFDLLQEVLIVRKVNASFPTFPLLALSLLNSVKSQNVNDMKPQTKLQPQSSRRKVGLSAKDYLKDTR